MLLPTVTGQVVVLQPRRLATRLLARRVAAEMGCEVGGVVGYQTRHERQVSGDTRILFLTQGLFLRMLAGGDGLAGVSVVVLDEFHERHLDGDVALALCRRAQATSQPSLQLVIMSATLDAEAVAQRLGCPALRTEQRQHPVEVIYRKERPGDGSPVWDRAARAVQRTIAESESGDVLVFMPGLYEIERTMAACRSALAGHRIDVVPLYGELPTDAQDLAVTPGPRRKVIVATNVAETSITIESVHHVVDSGLVRRLLYDPRRQFNMLAMQRISQSSADQRAGRAGRVAPGTCRRLWSLHEQRSRPAQDEPDIARLDLASHLLVLHGMGIWDVGALPWFQEPNPETLSAAKSLLELLGALDGDGMTPIGHGMALLAMHPRLARVVVAGAGEDCDRVALWAALLAERDLFLRDGAQRFEGLADQVFPHPFARVEAALEHARRADFSPQACGRLGIHGAVARQVLRTADLFRRSARRLPRSAVGKWMAAEALVTGFPDQVGVRRSDGSPVYDLPGGRSVHLEAPDPLPHLLVAAEVTEVGTRSGMVARVGLFVPLTTETLGALMPQRMKRSQTAVWDEGQKAVRYERQTLYDDLVVSRETFLPPYTGDAAAMLAERIARGELPLKRWGEKEEAWLQRVRCVAQWFPERGLITYQEDDLELVYQEICEGATRYSQVRDRPCLEPLKNVLSYADRQFVEAMAPERVKLQRGYGMRITYLPGELPRGRAKIQDFYGMTETPTVAGGRVKVLLEILAPNFRPIQTTDDLGGFWERTYPEVKRQLSRRYPRHEWR
jgi:ATP-dependent helicase HrpB